MRKVIHQIDKKWLVAPLSTFYTKIWVSFCINKSFYRFYFKNNRKSIDFSKKRTRGFQIGFLFERSTYFCVTVTGYFERFQYINFEKKVLKMKTFFKKLQYRFLAESTKIENSIFRFKTGLAEANVKKNEMECTKWTYCTEQSLASNCFFLKILSFSFSLRTYFQFEKFQFKNL